MDSSLLKANEALRNQLSMLMASHPTLVQPRHVNLATQFFSPPQETTHQ